MQGNTELQFLMRGLLYCSLDGEGALGVRLEYSFMCGCIENGGEHLVVVAEYPG